jgi:predicted GNAT family N-acyltransferase
MIQIKQISAQETYPIRLEVLRKGIPLPYEFNGDFDKDTFHLGAFLDKKLVGVSSFMKVNNDKFKGSQYQLRGMATLEESRGFGVGRKMMEAAFEVLKERQIDCLWCNARIVAVEFYKKLGLHTFGNLFSIKYVGDHYVMYKHL